MSNKFTRNNYKQFENSSDPRVYRRTDDPEEDFTRVPFVEDRRANSVTHKIHAAINSLRLHGWLDIEEFRLQSQFIDTRALFFKLDELFDREPMCISDQKEIVSMQRNELRPLIEQAISIWGPPPAQ